MNFIHQVLYVCFAAQMFLLCAYECLGGFNEIHNIGKKKAAKRFSFCMTDLGYMLRYMKVMYRHVQSKMTISVKSHV